METTAGRHLARHLAKPLTSRTIEYAPPGTELSDGGTGLRVRVGPRGAVFKWWATVNGKRKVITLGRFSPTRREGFLTLSEARRKLLDLKMAKEGGTLGVEGVETVGDLLRRWLADYADKHHRRPKFTRRAIERDVLPALGHKPLSQLTPRAIAAVIEEKAGTAPTAAGTALSFVKTALAWAVGRGYIPSSPAAELKPKALGAGHGARKRTLRGEELGRVWLALDEVPMMLVTRLAFKLLVLTGVRPFTLTDALRSEFDLAGGPTPATGLWTVPPLRAKVKARDLDSADPFLVPLSPDAVALVRELMALDPESRWLCASPRSSSSGHIKSTVWNLPLQAVAKAAGVEPFAPTDMRRTVRSWCSEAGVDYFVSEGVLGHRQPGVAGVYDRSRLLEGRAVALCRYADHVRELASKLREDRIRPPEKTGT